MLAVAVAEQCTRKGNIGDLSHYNGDDHGAFRAAELHPEVAGLSSDNEPQRQSTWDAPAPRQAAA